LTEDANDYGAADAPDPTPSVRPLLNTLHRVVSELDGDPNRAELSEIVAHTIDAATVTAPHRPVPIIIADIDAAVDAARANALATRRAALADRLMLAHRYSWADIEHAVWAFDRDRTNCNCAARLAELLVDLIDGAL
jgi:hypothetical protein